MRILNINLIIVMMVIALVSCDSDNQHGNKIDLEKYTVITVKKTNISKAVAFTGKLQSSIQIPVHSPMEGIVNKMHFRYDHEVKKGQPLFTITSVTVQQKYEDSIIQYLKTKNAVENSERNLLTEERLLKKGLVSRNEYLLAQNQYLLDRLAFMVAKADLTPFLDAKTLKTIDTLKLAEIDTLVNTLQFHKQSKTVIVYSPVMGVATKSGEKELVLGSKIDKDQSLLYINAVDGLLVDIYVDEVYRNFLKIGEKAKVSDVTLPAVVLSGKIFSISSQAIEYEGLPHFLVRIKIAKVPDWQSRQVYFNTNADVSINVALGEKIVIPFNAVDPNRKTVLTINEKTGKITPISVITGEVIDDKIIILQGLQPGDKILASKLK